jgi:thiamine biosynthesis protein ThiS
MQITVNGEVRDLPSLTSGATLADLIAALELKGDRIAVEHNGLIAPRNGWSTVLVAENDKVEVVHFVGGGTPRTQRSAFALIILLLALVGFLSSRDAAAQGSVPAPPSSYATRAGAAQLPILMDPPPDLSGKPTFTVKAIRPDATLKIVAYGDSRFTDASNTTDAIPRPRKWLVDRIAEEAPDAIFFSGDMPFHGSDPADWLVYQQETQPWRTAHLRLYPTLGNHEVAPTPRPGLANYFANFPYLENHRWYSVQIGSVYLIALDSLWPPMPGTAQRAWLEAQLAHLPAKVNFVFFLSHMPLVTDTQTQIAISLPLPDQIELRSYIESESRKSHAKFVVLNGHIHNYERYERNGVSYIVTGGGGAKPYPVMIRADDDLYRQPGFPNFHYLVLQIHGKHADVTMKRIADPTAVVYKSEIKDTFSLDAK